MGLTVEERAALATAYSAALSYRSNLPHQPVRPSVGLDEAVARVTDRHIQGAPLSDLQMVQGHIADMALDVDASALLVYRAAWTKDSGAPRVSREAAMAKLFSTEQAQSVIDRAVQLHGGDGVRSGQAVEALYRDIRALRIYEGASDVQRVIIARATLDQLKGK